MEIKSHCYIASTYFQRQRDTFITKLSGFIRDKFLMQGTRNQKKL